MQKRSKFKDVLGRVRYQRALVSFALRIGSALLGFVAAAYIVRLAGANAFGQYSLFVSIASILAATVAWGLPNYLSRELPRYLDKPVPRHYFVVSAVSLVLGCVGGVALLGVQWALGLKLDENYMLLALLVGILAGAGMVIDGAIRGLGGVLRGQFAELILRPTLLILLIAVAGYAWEVSVWSLMVIVIVCYFCSFVFSGIVLLQIGRSLRIEQIPYHNNAKTEFTRIGVIGISSWLDAAATQLPMLMIGFFASYDDAAAFRIIFYIVPVYAMAIKSIALDDYFNYSRAYGANDLNSVNEIHVKSIKKTLIYYSILTLVIIIIGPEILLASVGGSVKIDSISLSVLCIGLSIAAAFGTINMRLLAAGQEYLLVVAQIAGLILTTVSGALLIDNNPVLGATLAYVIGYGGSKLVMLFAFRRIHNFK